MHKLEIKWEMHIPPLEPKDWYLWKKPDLCANNLEGLLHWPQGTIGILEEAFKHRLPRFKGWKREGEWTDEARAALKKASEVYKRGVLCEGEQRSALKGSYPVEVPLHPKEAGFDLGKYDDHFLIVDAGLKHHWPIPSSALVLSINEQTKILESVQKIINSFHSSSKQGPWIIAGGGVLSDTAAFAASLLGQEFTLIPTTLLSMVDACVGGKTGVNFSPYGKNQLGHFAFPNKVITWPGWINTLSDRDLRSGISEAIKHALLQKPELLSRIESSSLSGDFSEILADLIEVKAKVVAKDPTENGERATLNLGHTLAHALEGVSHRSNPSNFILHGEAVGVGLLFCSILSNKMGIF